MHQMQFYNLDCKVEIDRYRNNDQPSIELSVEDTQKNIDNGYQPGEPVMTATTCIPGYSFGLGETAIKNYSENQGILEALIDASIVKDTGKKINSGFVELPVVKVLITP